VNKELFWGMVLFVFGMCAGVALERLDKKVEANRARAGAWTEWCEDKEPIYGTDC